MCKQRCRYTVPNDPPPYWRMVLIIIACLISFIVFGAIMSYALGIEDKRCEKMEKSWLPEN